MKVTAHNRIRWTIAVTFTVFCAMAMHSYANAAEKADPAIYGALPTVSFAEISPDGRTVAQIQSAGGVRAIAFYDLAGEKKTIGVELGDVDARHLMWAGPNHVLAMVSASKRFAWGHGLEPHEFWRLISVDRRSGDFSYLFSGATRFDRFFGSPVLISILKNEPDHILAGHVSNYGQYSIYKVNLVNGKEKIVMRGDRADGSFKEKFAGTVDWVVDADGAPAVRIDYYTDDEQLRFYKPDNNGGWTLASALPEKEADERQAIAYGLAGAPNLIYATMIVDGYKKFVVFNIDTGKIEKEVFSATGFDIGRAIVDYANNTAIGVTYVDNFEQTYFLRPDLQKIQLDLESALPSGKPHITSWSDDFMRIMVRISYNDHPVQFFLYDRDANSLALFSTAYGALDGRVAATKEKYDFTASDGMRIPGYLTVPAGAEKKNMPLVVLPHGGPWARDDQSFDWWAFFYAARGYLVYQPNFRGSSGYGEAFKFAGNGEWGRKMQNDLTEGAEKLIADGIVDQNRICIVGGSYGGYAALAGATLTPEVYACAVSVNGVSNVLQLLADRSGDRADNDYWKKRVGSRFDADIMEGINPVYEVTPQTPPIMLLHSEHDVVVPVGQSRVMRNALREAGMEHELIVMDGEDHWLSTANARTEMLTRSIEFIDRHIGQ